MNWLRWLFSIPEPSADETPEASWESDPVESRVGVHCLSQFGDVHEFVDEEITKEGVSRLLRSLDWSSKFHQVFVVATPGVSMEVGGSLDVEHGLCAC